MKGLSESVESGPGRSVLCHPVGMRFLRTVSTRRLLATIFGALAAAAGCAAIAVAATGAGPVPRPTTLAKGIHGALSAGKQDPVTGVSADITFTDNLIDSTDLTGRTVDPLLQGASGRLWWTAGGRFRLELQSGDGDAQIVVDQHSWWVSDPVQNVVFKGTMGSSGASGAGSEGSSHGLPTIASIQSELARLMQRFDITGPTATDVGGRPAYSVTVSPKTSAGLLGSIQLAWDATRGVPLQFNVYARGSATPVLGLQATSVSYGAIPSSVFDITPPAGAHIVNVGSSERQATGAPTRHGRAITGPKQVAARVSFPLNSPASVNGLGLRKVTLDGPDSALLLYGRGLGTIAVIESRASGASGAGSSPSLDGLSLPTHTVGGATAAVLSTPLGTVLRFTRGGVGYTVVGSVTATGAESAAGALAAGG
jgi:outer membrane lipoprotein-sorting protein